MDADDVTGSSIPLLLHEEGHEEGGAEVLVEVEIEGRRYVCLLDTGAATTTLPWDVWTSRMPTVGARGARGALGAVSEDLVTVQSLRLGPITRTAFAVARRAQHQAGRPLIGMDVLKDYCCRFLMDRRILVIERQPAVTEQDLMLDEGMHPYVPVTCGGTVVETVWDTGASLTVVDRGFIDAHPAAFRAAGESQGIDAGGNTATTPLFRMRGMACGGHMFPEHLVVGLDLAFVNKNLTHPMTMILGYSTLRSANWLFDFPSRRWDILSMISPTRGRPAEPGSAS